MKLQADDGDHGREKELVAFMFGRRG